MLSIDLTGKRALVAGVADDGGFGFAIAKALAEAGATVGVATWPPAMGIFTTLLRRGKLDESLQLARGGKLEFERVDPLDAEYDTLDLAPADIKENKRYRELGDFQRRRPRGSRIQLGGIFFSSSNICTATTAGERAVRELLPVVRGA